MIPVCLLILAGGIAAQHSRLPIDSDQCNVLFVAVVIAFFVPRVRWFAFALFGFALFMNAGNRIIEARLEPQFVGDSMLARVRIADFPRVTGASVSMLVEPISDPRLPARSRVSWFEPATIPVIGDVWEFELRLRRPYGNSNPGLFSLENWMFREKIHATGYIVAGKRNRLYSSGSLSWIEQYRRAFVVRVNAIGGEPAAVLAAIGVGARHLISRDQWERYATTGTSHLMAISGLHIGLAATAAFMMIVFVLGVCRLRGNHLDHGIISAAIVATLYAVISGFAVPSQRATMMLGLAALAFFSRRRADPARIVAAVALLVFIVDPISIMMPGFGLSFGAVVALLWFAKSASLSPRDERYLAKATAALRKLFGMQFALLFGLMPLTALIFHRISFIAPVANMIVVPVFSLITVPLTLASMIIHPVWEGGASWLLGAAAKSVQVVERVIFEAAQVPGASAEPSGIGGDDGTYLCFILLPAIWLVLPRGWPGRGIAPLGIVALLLHSPALPPRDCVDVHVLDVGQGLAVALQTRQRFVLFDTGASYRGGGSAAEQLVLPFMRYKGLDKIDWLVVSHADDDHAGGVSALTGEIAVGGILVGEPLPRLRQSSMSCVAGHSWRAGAAVFRVLHPGPGNLMTGNDSSCVIAVSVGEHQLILTGDIETAGEQRLLAESDLQGVTAVVIPHHGSLTSSSPRFVNRLRPNLAIASAGRNNRWDFPKDRVVRRWEGAGATVLSTASSGAISFRLCANDGISLLREERLRRRRFWHDSADL